MTQMTEAYDWRGRELIDPEGERIGKVADLYLDEDTGRPEWATVSTSLFGRRHSFVPLAGAAPSGGDVQVRVSREVVRDAPTVGPSDELTQDEEARLYHHYGLEYSAARSDSWLPASEGAGGQTPASGAVGHDVSGPTTDQAMTRSEEEIAVGTRQREAGRVRLRKYVVTEHVQQTVPVRREEVRIEREPVTEADVDQAMDGPPISDEEHEVVLHEEEPVVEKRVVPKERVRLDKETVVEERSVAEEVRREEIDVEGDERA